MTGPGFQEKAIEAVVIMNTAIINLRLYPSTNAMIMKTIDRLYDTLETIFTEEDVLLLAESERNLLISGEPLSQKNQQKPQVAIFLMLMLNWGIKSIGFNRGLDKSELSFFLEMMGKKPDDVNKEKGLEQLILEGKMPHIQMNQKIYVEMDQDRQIVASLNIKDEDIIEFITAEDPDAALDPAKVKEMAKDPEWFSRIIQAGMHHLVDRDGAQSDIKLAEGMLHMLRNLDKASKNVDKDIISHLVADSVSDMDADFIATMLTQNMEGLLENRLFERIVNRIDDDKFAQVAGKIRNLFDSASMEKKDPDSEIIQSIEQTYKHMMDSDKGIALQQQIQDRQVREEEEKQRRTTHIKETGRSILSRLEETLLPDASVLKSLPELIDGLFAEGETETAEAIFDRLTAKLLSDNSDTRAAAAESLVEILDHLSLERRTDILTKYLDGLLKWLKTETIPTNACRAISMQLKVLTQSRIRNQRFADSLPILETFRFIISCPIEKDDRIQSVAAEMLREIASADILEIVLDEFRFDRGNQRKDAGRNLVMMAEYSINRLLDLLHESQDRSERILILNLILEIGPAAAPAVTERIKKDALWYYLRNLVRLLGRVGSEEHAKILAPFLMYDDLRVQREAFKSINNIGGAFKGDIFLKALSGCDDQLKVGIVTTLGSLKRPDAVKPLIELFKSKIIASEELKTDLQEKICLALGSIGDKEALPFLIEVTKQSGIFGFKSYHPKVKVAAGRAVGMMRSKT